MSEEKNEKKEATVAKKTFDALAAKVRILEAAVKRNTKFLEIFGNSDIDGDSEIGGSAKRQLLVVLLGCACIAAIAYGTTMSSLTAESGQDALMGLTANDSTNAEWTFGSESTGNDFVWNVSSTQPMNLDASGNLTLLGTLTSVGGSTFGDLTCDDLTVNSNAVVTGTTDLNAAVTSTNITMDTGSTLAAAILTIATSGDFNGAVTATNITTDAGSTLTANGLVDLNAATTATNITMDTGSTLAANIFTAGGAADFNAAMTATSITTDAGSTLTANGLVDLNAATTATNITMDAGSTLAANIFTAGGAADFNAAVTCTNLTADAGATVTLANLGSLNLSSSAVNVNGATTSGTMAGGLAMSGETTIDSRYAAVGPNVTAGIMVLSTNITSTSDTIQTNSFETAFAAPPVVVCTYTENPGAAEAPWVQNVTTTNFECTVVADKNFGYIAAGLRP
jgi:cytoskeletal protein CcmA (bactofilin family)